MSSKKLYKPQRINILSRSITKDIFKKRGFKEQKVLTNWKDIVGDEISSYCIPESLTQNKILIVKCNSSNALEFQYTIPKIINRITLMMGYKAVAGIKIKQGRVENENKELNSILSKVKDEKLKENLSRFAKSFFSEVK